MASGWKLWVWLKCIGMVKYIRVQLVDSISRDEPDFA